MVFYIESSTFGRSTLPHTIRSPSQVRNYFPGQKSWNVVVGVAPVCLLTVEVELDQVELRLAEDGPADPGEGVPDLVVPASVLVVADAVHDLAVLAWTVVDQDGDGLRHAEPEIFFN